MQKTRFALIVFTVIEIGYLLFNFFGPAKWMTFLFYNKLNWILWVLNYGIAGFCVFYTWKYLPIPKKEKTNNTLMILFLGIIGMWLWLPNENDLKNYSLRLNRVASK